MMVNRVHKFDVLSDGREFKLPDTTFKWQNIDNVYVPKSFFTRKGISLVVSNARQHGEATSEASFTWFRFNSELDESLFDIKKLEELKIEIVNLVKEEEVLELAIDRQKN